MTRPFVLCCFLVTPLALAQPFHPSIPKAWDDGETTSFELPLAQADRSPRYPSAKEYYNMPVRPVYRTYPFYDPDKEPVGYWESLQQKEPEVLFDPAKLKTKEDWIGAGELVFDQPIVIVPGTSRARYQANFRAVPMPTTREGIVPQWFYVVRKKGVVELGFGGCIECHTRAMPDGSFLKGAQSNLPQMQSQAWRYTDRGRGPEVTQRYRDSKRSRDFAPWAANQDAWDQITLDEIVRRAVAMSPGVMEREGTSTKHPVKIPSLFGIEDLRCLDATGLSRNRNVGDLMRYTIVNQGLISVARYGDYDPKGTPQGGDTRYASDEQLYSLSLYLEGLKPPPNPNPFDEEAKRGQAIFNYQGCSGCHPAPLYTNNSLTPARGFTIPADLRKTESILDVSVGTDPSLALETRRGTGFYKVPRCAASGCATRLDTEGKRIRYKSGLIRLASRPTTFPKGFTWSQGRSKVMSSD